MGSIYVIKSGFFQGPAPRKTNVRSAIDNQDPQSHSVAILLFTKDISLEVQHQTYS